jgi:hypothetical protein
MSRATTFLAIGMVLVVSIYMQDVARIIIGPGSTFWELLQPITWPVDGDVWAEEMYIAVSVWVPWIIRIAAIAGGIYREFTKQNVTARAAAGRGGP